MRKVEKTALVIGLIMVLFCLISFAVLMFTDFWVAPLKSTAEVTAAARSLIALDRQFPFKAPQGAGIPQERLEPFLTASCRTKASADAVQASIEREDQVRVADQTVYSKEGGDLMIAYVKDISAALSEVKMGPEEFDWIHQRLRLASKGMPSKHKRQEMQETLEEMVKASEDPQLGDHDRNELKRHIAELETLPDAWGPVSQADWALYQANAERIKACVHGNGAVRALNRLLIHASGETRVHVEYYPDEDTQPTITPVPPLPTPPEPSGK